MNEDAILELLIKAKDEATATLTNVGKAVDDAAKKSGEMSKAFKVAGGVLTGAGIAGFAAMKDWVTAAAEAEGEMAKVDAIVNTVAEGNKTAFTNIRKYVDAAAQSYIKLGFDDETTAISFAKLFQSTMDTNEANKLLALSADIARYKNVDLSTATLAVLKATQGSTKELKNMGIAVEDGATAEQNLAAIQKTVAGQAESYGNTVKGRAEALQVQYTNLREELGARLLPVVVKIMEAVGKFMDKIGQLNPKTLDLIVKVVAIGSALALVIGPILMLIGFLPALSAGFGMLAAVSLPVIGIIAGIVAVVALVIVAFKNWDKITEFVGVVFTAIGGFFTTLWDTISTFFINAWAKIVNFFTPLYEFIKSILTAYWNIFSYIFNAIYTVVAFVVQGIWSLIQIVFWAIYEFIAPTVQAIWQVISDAFNAVWTTVSTVLGNVWNTVTEKFTAISGTIKSVFGEVVGWFGTKIDGLWTKVTDITSKIWNAFVEMATKIKEALTSIKFPHISLGSGTTNVAGHDVSYPKINVDWYEQGGWVKNTGLAVVHQGEYVLSKDMLKGNKPVSSAITTNKSQPITINLVANTPVDLDMLSYKLAFALRNN